MKNCILLFLLIIVQSSLFAQSPAKIKRTGDKLFDIGNYKEALHHFDQVKEKYVKDLDLKYKIGVCYFHLNNTKESIEYLSFYRKNAPKLETLTYYYLARAHHLQHDFREAARYYKSHLKELSSSDPNRNRFKALIVQCTSGPKVEQINSGAVVSTLGNHINSTYDDYNACFNPKIPNTIFFSSNRAGVTGGKLNDKHQPDEEDGYYRSDIFQSELVHGNWNQATALSSRYNTNMSEDIVSFFDNGYQILLLKGFSDGHQEIVKENFDEDSLEVILPFAIGASSNHWDSDHFFASDSLILFASNRPGGYGGKDLYYSTLSEEGWSKATNLGAAINSKYDEEAPFLAKNGRTLYFSSNNLSSMGGLDIYKTTFNDSTRSWGAPKNLGMPINSPADDNHFNLDKDGLKAYFCSKRIDGMGGYDLYSAYFRTYRKEHLQKETPSTFVDVLTNITSLANNTPTSSTVNKLTPTSENQGTTQEGNKTIYNISPIYYNAETGKIEGSRNTIKALTRLLTKYPESIVVLSGHADNTTNAINDLYLTVKQSEELAKSLLEDGAQNKQIWIRGCGQNYPIANNENFDGSPNVLGNKMNRRINVNVFNVAHLSNQMQVNIINPEVSSVMRNPAYTRYQSKLKGLSYKVQLTETASLFNHNILKELPHATTEKHPDDVNVKYLVGLENSFEAIKRVWDAVVAKGFDRATIVPYVNGVRISEGDAQVLFTEYKDLSNFLEFQSN